MKVAKCDQPATVAYCISKTLYRRWITATDSENRILGTDAKNNTETNTKYFIE